MVSELHGIKETTMKNTAAGVLFAAGVAAGAGAVNVTSKSSEVKMTEAIYRPASETVTIHATKSLDKMHQNFVVKIDLKNKKVSFDSHPFQYDPATINGKSPSAAPEVTANYDKISAAVKSYDAALTDVLNAAAAQ